MNGSDKESTRACVMHSCIHSFLVWPLLPTHRRCKSIVALDHDSDTLSLRLLWTRYRPFADRYLKPQNIHNRKFSFPRRDSNTQSQQVNERRPTPYTMWPPGSTNSVFKVLISCTLWVVQPSTRNEIVPVPFIRSVYWFDHNKYGIMIDSFFILQINVRLLSLYQYTCLYCSTVKDLFTSLIDYKVT
jgi:hypothetical protein